jgi:hypothetical protein
MPLELLWNGKRGIDPIEAYDQRESPNLVSAEIIAFNRPSLRDDPWID